MMRASNKQVSIPIPTLVKCFSWFLSESDYLSFERVCSVGQKNFFKNCCCISSQARMDPGLKFCSHVLALSSSEKGKSFNLMVFMYNLSHYKCYRPPQIPLNANIDFLNLSHEKKVKVE